jgi:glucose/galactose transporter
MTTAAMKASSSRYLLPLLIIGSLFFVFGFVTWVNGALIPYLKIACELKSEMQSFLVVTAFFMAYFVMGIPSAMVLKRTGYKKGMSLGLLVMAVGTLAFIPAAYLRSFGLFLSGLFIIGTGLALLQTASNPYASIIGPIESAASRISIMGICNKVAGILANVVFGFFALQDTDALLSSLQHMDVAARSATLDALAMRVVNPYLIITLVLLALAVAIYFSGLPDIKEEATTDTTANTATGKTSIWQFPHLLLGMLAIFLYVGVEVMAGDTIISYGITLGIPITEAKFFTSATLTCMLIGYIAGIFLIPKYIRQQDALKICALLGALFSTLAIFTNGYTSVLFIALLGLANSLMWPAIFPLAINKLGRFTKTGSALLVMSCAGGAILPLIYGYLTDSRTAYLIQQGVEAGIAKGMAAQVSYWMMIPCYLYVLYYAVRGHKVR